MHDLPLTGIRVLDLTTFLSGPSATQLLGDLGAEIIKVEPAAGDSSRAIPPHYIDGMSAYFLGNNRNKRSVCVNLKSPEGQEIVRRLALECDVVYENFRPGVAARLGLDAAELCAAKPDLIWTSISGFGQDGPWRDRPAYDMIVQALSGAMSLTGHPDAPAARLGIPAGDLLGGLYAVIGTLAALHARGQTGRGRAVDVSMLDGMLSVLSYQAIYAAHTGIAPGPQGARHDSIPTYRSFRASDGREFVVTANTERMWVGLCGVIGHPELPGDERFATPDGRHRNRDQLWAILEAAFLTRPAAEWVDALVAAQVPAAPIKNVTEALADARDHDRGMVIDLGTGDARFAAIATPIGLPGTAPQPATYPPRVGEHTADILGDLLRIGPDELGALAERGVLPNLVASAAQAVG